MAVQNKFGTSYNYHLLMGPWSVGENTQHRNGNESHHHPLERLVIFHSISIQTIPFSSSHCTRRSRSSSAVAGMDLPKHRATGTTSLRDDSDFSKMEGTGSWDAIEWTKIEVPISIQSPSPSSFYLTFSIFFCFVFFPVNFVVVIYLQPISRYVSHANLDFLLEAEQVVAEVCIYTFVF